MSEVFAVRGAAHREVEPNADRVQAMTGAPAHPSAELRQKRPGSAVTDDELYERLWDAAAWNDEAWVAYSAGETARGHVQRVGRHGRFRR